MWTRDADVREQHRLKIQGAQHCEDVDLDWTEQKRWISDGSLLKEWGIETHVSVGDVSQHTRDVPLASNSVN